MVAEAWGDTSLPELDRLPRGGGGVLGWEGLKGGRTDGDVLGRTCRGVAALEWAGLRVDGDLLGGVTGGSGANAGEPIGISLLTEDNKYKEL